MPIQITAAVVVINGCCWLLLVVAGFNGRAFSVFQQMACTLFGSEILDERASIQYTFSSFFPIDALTTLHAYTASTKFASFQH